MLGSEKDTVVSQSYGFYYIKTRIEFNGYETPDT